MQLRFIEDRRSLFWACVLFPLLPALVYWRPFLGPYLFPLIIYLAYCSGVLTHNHSHTPMFKARAYNEAYSAWLSVFYGCPIFVWVPTHHLNHHVHVNGPGDATRTTRLGEESSLFTALTYPFRSSRWQWPAIREYVASARQRSPRRFRRVLAQTAATVVAHASLLGLALWLHGALVGGLVYALAFGVPAAFAPWSMMLTNYLQHVDCEEGSTHDHSRNFTHPLINWLIFDNGFHTVHHDQPKLHWSRLRARHRELEPRIQARLNQSTALGFLVGEYRIQSRSEVSS
jgi:fatty acid desaturase